MANTDRAIQPSVVMRLPAHIESEVLPTLANAIDSLQFWGGYVEDYYKHKYAFDADVAQIQAVANRLTAILEGRDGMGEYD